MCTFSKMMSNITKDESFFLTAWLKGQVEAETLQNSAFSSDYIWFEAQSDFIERLFFQHCLQQQKLKFLFCFKTIKKSSQKYGWMCLYSIDKMTSVPFNVFPHIPTDPQTCAAVWGWSMRGLGGLRRKMMCKSWMCATLNGTECPSGSYFSSMKQINLKYAVQRGTADPKQI